MNEIAENPHKRKILSLKKQESAIEKVSYGNFAPQFVVPEKSVYMVWCDGGDMPKRIYKPHERNLAVGHARSLSRDTGKRFFVMRAWRGYEPE